MLQSIISSKVEKSKQNIDSYLTSSSQPAQGPMQRDRDQGQAMRPNQQATSSAAQNQSNPVTPGNPATVPNSSSTASSNKNSNNKQLAKNEI